jgi:hypothetical protein
MKAIFISAIILCVLIWWIAIYFFGIWGAIGCMVVGISSALIMNKR